MKKRGRPLKEDSKHNQYRLRMTEKDFEMLEYMADKKVYLRLILFEIVYICITVF